MERSIRSNEIAYDHPEKAKETSSKKDSSTVDHFDHKFPTIKEFYKNKVILITGATGLLGRFLVYKLLKETDPEKIYILIRGKKGVPFEKRYKEYLEEEIFTHLLDRKKKKNQEIIEGESWLQNKLSLIHGIEGDICYPNFGISCPMKLRKLTQEINIIIHSAASIKFNEEIR